MAGSPLYPRQTDTTTGDISDGDTSGGNALLNLISDPFSTELQSTSFFAALVYATLGPLLLGFLFCLLRPRTNAVYAPRAKHADSKHAPPRLSNGLFSWIGPIKNLKEPALVNMVGLDAVIFLRFLRMTRNIFLVLSVLGCGILIPINLGGTHTYAQYGKVSYFIKFTPQYITGSRFWAFTVCAYLFDIVICGFLWWNYRAVLRLRREYFESQIYQSGLHSRTLMVTHIPNASRTDEGMIRIAEDAKPTADHPRAAIARNVRDLPDLIEEHEESVKKLEKVLAAYLSNPNKLPINRPTCKPSKRDKARHGNQNVDAIEYYTSRIRELELQIKQVRESVDTRNPLPYGFASYTHIEDAHAVAYATRSKGPQGTRIRLAPKPSDLIWKNLAMSRVTRRTRSFWNTIWITTLTGLFIVPNILTAVFLSDFNNLGQVWPAFRTSLDAHPTWWGIVSGIVAPAFQNLFYLTMPIIFRRLLNSSGDTTKTSRERHVMSRLYIFFVFNNLIVFSIFSALWRFAASLIYAHKQGNEDTWTAIKTGHIFEHIVLGLCSASTYWITWQLQHNLGVALDIVQYWPLMWGSLVRKFGHPTPRETIQLSAPPPLDYAPYYNNYLFAATVGFCFATIQPLILPITALYIGADAWLKKYMVLYIVITKTESGGLFWRTLVNRVLFGALLGNLTVALVVGGQGLENAGPTSSNAIILYALVPTPFLLWAFKWYCSRTFDPKIAYYTTRTLSDLEGSSAVDSKSRRNDRVAVRFGNPALYKKLMTPMVAAKSQHMLKQIYGGRLDQDMDGVRVGEGVYGYSDVYMSNMSREAPGKSAGVDAPFEIVPESEMNFENFKKRAEFREEFGGDGELYGRDDDQSSLSGSMSSMSTLAMMGGKRRPESPGGFDSAADGGTTYPRGYNMPANGLRGESPRPSRQRMDSTDITVAGHPSFRDDDRGRLVQNAGPMGGYDPYERSDSTSRLDTPDVPLGLTPGLMQTPGSGTPGDEETSYDYFRRGRRY